MVWVMKTISGSIVSESSMSTHRPFISAGNSRVAAMLHLHGRSQGHHTLSSLL